MQVIKIYESKSDPEWEGEELAVAQLRLQQGFQSGRIMS